MENIDELKHQWLTCYYNCCYNSVNKRIPTEDLNKKIYINPSMGSEGLCGNTLILEGKKSQILFVDTKGNITYWYNSRPRFISPLDSEIKSFVNGIIVNDKYSPSRNTGTLKMNLYIATRKLMIALHLIESNAGVSPKKVDMIII
jgi:hypothetical protein